MTIKRLLSILRRYRPYLLSVPVTALVAWLGWVKLSQPSPNDFGEPYARVIMTFLLAAITFALVVCLILAIESEISLRKSN